MTRVWQRPAPAARFLYSELVPTSYDTVLYPTNTYSQTHPDRLATIATLFSMQPAPPGACRVLEIGCGDGGNLIPMAWALPGSTFLGIDCASTPIRAALAAASALGVKNVEFRALDLMDAGPLGAFDYIIAHGFYSWVPEPVRERLLAVCRSCLAPQGVAYVSYNTQPGGHLRRIVRETLQHHTRGIEDPQERLRRAREFVAYIADWEHPVIRISNPVAEEFKITLERPPNVLFHDDLAEVNEAFYFEDFAAAAGRHGLQFLAEADLFEMAPPPEDSEREAAIGLPPVEDVLRREQYFDLLRCRRFRRTLLCHAETRLDRSLPAAAFQSLLVSSDCRSVAEPPSLTPGAVLEFVTRKGAKVSTGHPFVKAALLELGERWPAPAPVAELPELVRSRLEKESGAAAAERALLGGDGFAAMLRQLYCGNFIELHAAPPGFVTEISEFPEASALARAQLAAGPSATNLRHTRVEVEDDAGRTLITLMDGTRDLAALRLDCSAALGREIGEAGLRRCLETAARNALLVR